MKALINTLAFAATVVAGTTAQAYALKVDDAGHAVRWAEMPVAFSISADGGRDFKRAQAVSAVRDAFAAWEGHDGAELSFKFLGEVEGLEAGYSQRGENTNAIVWSGDDWTFDNEALAMTVTLYRSSTAVLVDADIVINERDYIWSVDGGPENDLHNALAHEVGHFIGLDHSEIKDATMFASAGRGETNKRDLDADDLAAIQKLYPGEFTQPNGKANLGAFRDDSLPGAPADAEPQSFDAPKVGCTAAVPGGGSPLSALGVFALLGLGAAARRRR